MSASVRRAPRRTARSYEDTTIAFKPAVWYPIAIGLSAINLAGAGFAVPTGDPWHVTLHVALAVVFAVWARRLRLGPGASDVGSRIEALEADARLLRQELSETQERLDFAERLLAQGSVARGANPPR